MDMQKIIEESFAQYSGAVLQSRALVDVRDCLKPSARQIFYCLYTDKFTHDKPFQKTLKSIAAAFRLYIHGDSSAEGVIMRAGQPFAMRYPLVEVEGSYGNLMESGNWSAPRYTSSRLSALSNYLFKDIKKDTINEWRDNYDDTEKYPAVLPSKGFYNLVNGTMGIGIAMSSSVPQFNIKELNKALIYLLYHPDCEFKDIYCAPDFATGGIILNEEEVKQSIEKGSGKSCRIRSKIDYDYKDSCLIVSEIPYGVYTNTICKQLEEIIESEENPGIERFNDLTGEKPNIKIYLKRNANEEKVLQYLYKNTSLEYWYSINFTMLSNNGRFPRVFSWKEMLQAHLDHEKEIYRNGFEYDLRKIKERLHIIEGILIVIARLEEVIQTIKTSMSAEEASKNLQKNYLLDEVQAKAVLAIKLSQLARLEVKKYEDERDKLNAEKARIENILSNESLFNKEIEKGYLEVAKIFGDDRRTVVTNIARTEGEEVIEQRVPEENCVVIKTESGLIKRIPSNTFKVQRRNTAGIKNKDGIITDIIRTNTVDSILAFSDKGKLYKISVKDIPVGNNDTKGIYINNLISLDADESITLIYSLYHNTDAKYVLFMSEKGYIKKTPLDEYVKTKRKNGVVATAVREGDRLISVNLIKDEPLIIITERGMAIRFNSSDLSSYGKTSVGIKGIELNKDDKVVEVLPIRDESDCLAVFTEKGLGKRMKLDEFPTQKRGGKGLICYKPSANTGLLVSAALVNDDDNILICGNRKGICISAKDISISGRTSIGVGIIKDGTINSASKI